MSSEAHRITKLLQEFRRGEAGAESELASLVYGPLKKVAHNRLAGERRNISLESADVIGMAYKRIFRGAPVDWKDRAHFFAIAATQIHWVLVEYARARKGATRRRDKAVPLDDVVIAGPQPLRHFEAVHELLEQLAKENPQAARVTELKYFGGLTDKEVAEVLSIPFASVRRLWTEAKEWLKEGLTAA
jgi:RNA polymerase sigma-70 factor (ECF subfamily)